MNQSDMGIASRGRRAGGVAGILAIVLMALAVLAAPSRARDKGKVAPPADPLEAVPDFLISGRFAEACTDQPLCVSWFGSPSCSGSCRKLLVFQILRSRYGAVPLNNLTVIVAIESGAGGPVTIRDRDSWRRCDLILPDAADSAETWALREALSVMIWGNPVSRFTTVRSLPLAIGFTPERVIAESSDAMKIHIRPLPTQNGLGAPEITNLVLPFPFVSGPSVYRAETLSYTVPPSGSAGAETPAPEVWSASNSSAAVGVFIWTRDAMMREARVAAGGAP